MSTEYVDVTFAVTGERLTDDEQESLAVAFEAWCTAAGREPVTMATNPRDPAERDRQVAEQAWDEGYNKGLSDGQRADGWCTSNPYRADSAAPDERERTQWYTTVLANLNRERARAVAAEAEVDRLRAALAARPAPTVSGADDQAAAVKAVEQYPTLTVTAWNATPEQAEAIFEAAMDAAYATAGDIALDGVATLVRRTVADTPAADDEGGRER